MKQPLSVVKIGGEIIDDPQALKAFLMLFSQLKAPKILVHGGGKTASATALQLGLVPELIEGRRKTDQDMLQVVTMVYSGWINKTIVSQLQSNGCDAIGLSGCDANLIRADLRDKKRVDYGWVGDLSSASVDVNRLTQLLNLGLCPVFSAITHDHKAQLLNTNADTLAAYLAVSLTDAYAVTLLYCFDKKGVLTDRADDSSWLAKVDASGFKELSAKGIVAQGMLPKLNNAIYAAENGVEEVYIKKADDLLISDIGTQVF